MSFKRAAYQQRNQAQYLEPKFNKYWSKQSDFYIEFNLFRISPSLCGVILILFKIIFQYFSTFFIICRYFSRREKREIPFIVTSCIREVERRGMQEVGIYRVSGSASDLARLKKAFESSKYWLFRQLLCIVERPVSHNWVILLISSFSIFYISQIITRQSSY